MFYVFLIQNKFNNKIYIGCSTLAPNKRKHCNEFAQLIPKSNRLHKIILEHRGDQFSIVELEKFKNLSDAEESEEFWIQYFETRNPKIGYNLSAIKTDKKKKDAAADMENANIRKMFLSGDYSVKDLSYSYNVNNKSMTKIIENKGYLDEAEDFDIEVVAPDVIKHPKVLMDEFGMEFDTMELAAEYYGTTVEEIVKKLRNKKSSDKKLPSFFWLKTKLIKKSNQ